MANENTSRQRRGTPDPKGANTKQSAQQQTPSTTPASSSGIKKSSRNADKGNKPRIGGTATPGAKSMQPKQTPTSRDPNQQQIANYNRDTRRRMQHIGAGPYSENEQQGTTLQQQRRKRLERRKQRLEERRKEVLKSVPGGKISLGRKNTYFVIAVIVLIVLLIAIFVILRATHVL